MQGAHLTGEQIEDADNIPSGWSDQAHEGTQPHSCQDVRYGQLMHR